MADCNSSNCVNTLGSCVTYDGGGISGLSYADPATINEVLDTVGALAVQNRDAIEATENIIKVSRLFTSSELNSLPGTPITLVSAVTDKIIVADRVFWKYTHVTTGFTNSAGAVLKYISTSVNISSVANTFATTATHTSILVATDVSATTTDLSSKGIQLAASGTFSGGDGNIEVTLWYYLK